MINGDGLHHVAIIIRQCATMANSSPHAHVKCVVGGRFLCVVQPNYKIVGSGNTAGELDNAGRLEDEVEVGGVLVAARVAEVPGHTFMKQVHQQQA